MFVFNPLGWLLIGSLILMGCSTVAQSPVNIEVPPPASASPSLLNSVETPKATPQNLPVTARLQVGTRTVFLEVATTQEEQMIGLMYRTSMSNDRGMLFTFAQPSPAKFWMKNTLIPLDILFLRNGKIAHIESNVPPCKADPCPNYGPENSVIIDQVLELNAGQAKVLNLKVGDRLTILPL